MQRIRTRILCLGIGASLIFLGSGAQGVDFLEKNQVVANNGSADDRFGRAVEVNGSFAIVGAPESDVFGDRAGEAYIFEYDCGRGNWFQTSSLRGSCSDDNDFFGHSVAIGGDLAIVGAHHEESAASGAGAVYVFRFDPQTSFWVEERKLTASDALSNARFGSAVSLDGNVVLIGAPDDNTGSALAGKAYIYRYDWGRGIWVEEQILQASDVTPSAHFGSSVSIRGDLALVGAPSGDAPGVSFSGAVYVFRFDPSSGSWIEVQKLSATDAALGDNFGLSVSLGEGLAAVGAFLADGAAIDSGSVYVFRSDETGTWTQEEKLSASNGASGEFFGWSVSLSGNRILTASQAGGIDNSGAGYLYSYDSNTGSWGAEQILRRSTPAEDDFLGTSVSLSGTVALLGASGGVGIVGSASFFHADALSGSVNAGNGPVTDTLFVSGSTGGPDHTVELSAGQFFEVTIEKAPAGGSGRFLLHANVGPPCFPTELPFDVGVTAHPLLLPGGASPVIVSNGFGFENLVGASHYFGASAPDPSRAPATLFYPDLPPGTCITFQGVIKDPGSISSRGASVTNAVIVKVLP